MGALEYSFKNTGNSTLEVVFSYNTKNFMKQSGGKASVKPVTGGFILVEEGTKENPEKQGDFAIFTTETNTIVDHCWFRGGWWDPMTITWNTILRGEARNTPPVEDDAAITQVAVQYPVHMSGTMLRQFLISSPLLNGLYVKLSFSRARIKKDIRHSGRPCRSGRLPLPFMQHPMVSWEGLNSPDPVKASEGSLSSDYSAEARALLQKEGPKYQYGTGCLSDGILGAWIGEVCGLSNVVASHLMMMGETEKGLEIVRAARNRYDGRLRNPFDEYECGHWYARAMSSYAMLQALSGVRYDAVDQVMYISSGAGDFKSFFSTSTGFGNVGIKNGKPFLDVTYGEITIKDFIIE